MSLFDFDTAIERRGTGSEKWDSMEANFGIPIAVGLPMWVADTDFRAPDAVQRAVRRLLEHGVYGYHGDESHYRDAIVWWMKNRHGWEVDPASIYTTHGLVNGFGLLIDTFTQVGDGVILFSPVYHAFSRVIDAADRTITECPLVIHNGRYQLDLEAAAARLRGNERVIVLCSPHNPGGTVWTKAELQALANFARHHDLLIISDEIHHDIVFPGQVHTPMATLEGVSDRIIVMSAATKSFNIAGCHCGNIIVPDAELRGRFAKRLKALGVSGDMFGVEMTTAAYSAEGAQWLDALIDYFDESRKIFDDGVETIPGVASMRLEGTYLAWVDFTRTGLGEAEILRRVEQGAQIAVSRGTSFGAGGEGFLRFNLGMRRELIVEAVERLRQVFLDLR